MTITIKGRVLHFLLKIVERSKTIKFYSEILGMKVLRHEEYSEGCATKCNGPHNGRWSKTLMGYGPESNHFALELAYNYPITSYELGNDFIGITIKSREVLQRARSKEWPILEKNIVEAPGGYRFFIVDEPQPTHSDPIIKITLTSTNLEKTLSFWHDAMHLKELSRDVEQRTLLLAYSASEAKLEFKEIEGPIDHGSAYGRLAFSCPYDQQYMLDELIKNSKSTIVSPLGQLDTPGKISIRIMVVADPDGHEACILDEEGFQHLGKSHPGDEKLLAKYIKLDESGQLKDVLKVKQL